MIGAFVLGKAQKYKLPWRLLIVSFGAGCVLLALEIIWFRFLRLIGLTREDYPEYHDYLSITFSKVKQKPRVVEEHDSMAGILSSVEAGTGVAFGAESCRLLCLFSGEARLLQSRSFDWARTHRIHTNLAIFQLHRPATREATHGRLTCGVGGQAWHSQFVCIRRCQDDRATIFDEGKGFLHGKE